MNIVNRIIVRLSIRALTNGTNKGDKSNARVIASFSVNPFLTSETVAGLFMLCVVDYSSFPVAICCFLVTSLQVEITLPSFEE